MYPILPINRGAIVYMNEMNRPIRCYRRFRSRFCSNVIGSSHISICDNFINCITTTYILSFRPQDSSISILILILNFCSTIFSYDPSILS